MDHSEVDVEKHIGRLPRAAPATRSSTHVAACTRRGRLLFGNREPIQRLERYVLKRRFAPGWVGAGPPIVIATPSVMARTRLHLGDLRVKSWGS